MNILIALMILGNFWNQKLKNALNMLIVDSNVYIVVDRMYELVNKIWVK
jgi:hypothetical protein